MSAEPYIYTSTENPKEPGSWFTRNHSGSAPVRGMEGSPWNFMPESQEITSSGITVIMFNYECFGRAQPVQNTYINNSMEKSKEPRNW
jgi:hypothetical protein